MKLAPLVTVAITLASTGLVSAAPIEVRGASSSAGSDGTKGHSVSHKSHSSGHSNTNHLPAYGAGDGTGSYGGPMNLQGSGQGTPESSGMGGGPAGARNAEVQSNQKSKKHGSASKSKDAAASATSLFSNSHMKNKVPSVDEIKSIGNQRFLSKMKGMDLNREQSSSLINLLQTACLLYTSPSPRD